MWKPFTVHHFTVIKNLNCGIKQTNFETSFERIHCKMKRAKLTPKAKLAPMSWGPVWTLEVRFGLFKLKRVGQVPFRPLQNLNWPKWILLWNFFSIWPFQELCRIYQFWPQRGAIFEMTDNYPKIVNNFGYMEVPSRLKRHKDAGIWDVVRATNR